jgi:hypothetical protein
MQGKRIDGDDAVLIRELVELREPLHVIGILIQAMQQNDYRIMAPRVIAVRQPHQVCAVHVIDRDFFLGLLRR